MIDSEKKEFSTLMDAIMPVYRMEASAPTKLIWWNVLKNHELCDVSAAFSEHVKTNKFAPTPADIIALIDKIRPDGRPGADEAWAMIPMDEYTSAVMTQEMAEALHIAQPLIDEGDKIAARMSFKEAYTRIVESNKRNGVKPSWFPSIGQDKEGRDTVLAEAVRLGRMTADRAIGLLPPDKVAPMLQLAGETRLALEHKMPSAEDAMAKLSGIKEMLKAKTTRTAQNEI